MSSFEKKYYESTSFWENGMLEDEKNRNRIIRTAEFIPSSVSNLVDIGCGNGVFLNYLKETKENLELFGVDRSETALQFVKTGKKVGDIDALPFPDDSFDCVSCLEVIEHIPVPNYEKALQELCRISKKYVIISVPYAEKIEDSYTTCPQCVSIFNSDLHLRNYQVSDIESLLASNGYKCINHQTLGDNVQFVGHNFYRKLFYPEQLKRWNAPVCPICGFEEEKKRTQNTGNSPMTPKKRSVVSYFSWLPKLVWPKVTKPYWIMALYEKE